MATIHNSRKDLIEPIENRPTGPRGPHTTLPVDPVEQLIRDALDAVLQGLTVSPAGPLQAPALQQQPFQVVPPPLGVDITIPIPPLNQPITLLVTPNIEWTLFAENGRIATPGSTFAANPPALDAVAIQLLFFPQVVKDRAGVPTRVHFSLQATVQLTATHPLTGAIITQPKDDALSLPSIDINVPVALRIPPVLAMFGHKHFAAQEGPKKGFAIVFVPPASGVTLISDLAGDGKLGSLIDSVGALRSAIEALPITEQSLLAGFAGNLEGFLEVLNLLVINLSRFGPAPQPALALFLRHSDENLSTGLLIPGLLNDIEGENEVSSLIFIGLGETVRLYNRRNFKSGQGILRIALGEQMCAAIERLDSSKPTTTAGDPSISTPEPPNFAPRPDTFENALASFHFGDNPP